MDIVYIRLMDIVYIRYVRMHTHAQSVQRSASQQFVILATDGLWDVVSSQVCGEGKEEEEEAWHLAGTGGGGRESWGRLRDVCGLDMKGAEGMMGPGGVATLSLVGAR